MHIVACPNVGFVVAYCVSFFRIECGSNGQSEHIDTVATEVGGGQTIPNGIYTCLQYTDFHIVAFPNVGFVVASVGNYFLIENRSNGKNQGVNTVASVGRGVQTVINRVCASSTLSDLDVFVTSPYILFVLANRGGLSVEIVSRGNGQHEGVNTVASVGCGAQTVINGVCTSGTLPDLHVVTFPNILFIVANGSGFGLEVVGRGDGQYKGMNTVATEAYSGQTVVEGVNTCSELSDFNAFVTCPNVCFIVANGSVFGLEVVSRGHHKRQFIHAVTFIHCLQAVPDGVDTFCQVADSDVFVFLPYIVFVVANVIALFKIEGRIDGQIQMYDTVATMDGGQRVGVNATFCQHSLVGAAVKGIGSASGFIHCDFISGVDNQGECGDSVTTILKGLGHIVDSCGIEG